MAIFRKRFSSYQGILKIKDLYGGGILMDETVKESLKFLLEINDPQTKFKESKRSLQDINYERLANIADLLGMSDLYLKE